MADYDYDLYTIGIGSGGTRASRISAGYGARVAAAEERYYGGTCVNVGCVPKKLMVYASQFSDDFSSAKGFGWTVGERSFDWSTLINAKNTEISRLNGIYERMLNNAGVAIHDGRARIVDPHTVEVNGKRFTSKYILVAVGGWPAMPDIPGKELAITSNEVFFLQSQPKRVLIVGGGFIAVEFAGIFNGMGSAVVLTYRSEQILRGFDEDVRHTLAGEIVKKGVDLRVNTNPEKIEKKGDALLVTMEDGSTLETDAVMYATGRRPMTGDLGLENAGVKVDKSGAIIVDDKFKTSCDSVYALGDVINRIALTPVAIAEAMVLAGNLFNGTDVEIDYADVPSAVFSQPNVGTCGLTEAEARKRYGDVDIYKSTFTPMKHSLTGKDEKTFMKLIVDQASDRVVGFHMIGPDAGETTQGVAIALKCGATKAQFDATVGIHPTAAEEFVTMREKAN
jgi:glutathione reductase (NADPH)